MNVTDPMFIPMLMLMTSSIEESTANVPASEVLTALELGVIGVVLIPVILLTYLLFK